MTAVGIPLVACRALLALACLGLASCGGGPGGGRPDLVVAAPGLSDATPAAGASLVFSATVHNAGDRSAAATTLRVFRADDATITRSDEQVGAGPVAALAASASRVVTVESTPSSPGTSYYGACVDAVAGESDTANNCSGAIEVTGPDPASAAPLPDLVVESPAVSAGTPAAGANFTFSATVRNAGDGDAAATTLVVYRSADETITTSDQDVGEDTVKELAASATGPASMELTAPSSSGTYYYGACVHAVAEESDTANNCSAAVPVTVPQAPAKTPQTPAPGSPGPDLVVVGTSQDTANPAFGGILKLSTTARNHGKATPLTTTVRFYHSEDATITRSDTQLATGKVEWPADQLYHQETWTAANVKAPSSKGSYYYGACVDAVAGESDTTNNCSAAVTVTLLHNKPDLRVSTWGASSRSAGSSSLLGTTVYNTGGPSEATTLRLLLLPSRTSAPSAGTEVGEVDLPELVVTHAWPASSTKRVGFQAPATPGWYHYVMCVDAVTGESDTTNNCSPATAVEFR